MQYRVEMKNGKHVYRVPEDLFPHVAEAMIAGGTAVKLPADEKKSLPEKVVTAVKETAAKAGAALRQSPKIETAAKR